MVPKKGKLSLMVLHVTKESFQIPYVLDRGTLAHAKSCIMDPYTCCVLDQGTLFMLCPRSRTLTHAFFLDQGTLIQALSLIRNLN